GSQVTPPLVASVPAKETPTGARYQPFAFGARDGVAVTVGAVASYLKANAAEAELPAASVQLPETDAEAVSGPLYDFAASQVTPVLSASLPLTETMSPWLNQPPESAARAAFALTVGAVASYLNVAVADAVLPAASVQEPLCVPVAVSGPR